MGRQLRTTGGRVPGKIRMVADILHTMLNARYGKFRDVGAVVVRPLLNAKCVLSKGSRSARGRWLRCTKRNRTVEHKWRVAWWENWERSVLPTATTKIFLTWLAVPPFLRGPLHSGLRLDPKCYGESPRWPRQELWSDKSLTRCSLPITTRRAWAASSR